MYIPKHFTKHDENVMYDMMEQNSFATLISQHKGESFATHLPLLLNRNNGYLYGHFARSNPQWKDIRAQQVLAIFHGPHSYISPSWYETNTAVPTWNYVAVHVYGHLDIIENNQEIMDSLHKMVQKYESPTDSYKLEEVDSDFIDSLNKGIVGFKIKIDKVEGKWKLSQNHSEERQKLVIQQLEKINSENSNQIALLMKDNLQK